MAEERDIPTIRVRSRKTGKLYVVPDAAFVELCTADGTLAAVVRLSPDGQEADILTPGDAAFARYTACFKRTAAKVHTLTWRQRQKAAMVE